MWTTAGDLVTPDPVISMVPDHPLPRGPAGSRTPSGIALARFIGNSFPFLPHSVLPNIGSVVRRAAIAPRHGTGTKRSPSFSRRAPQLKGTLLHPPRLPGGAMVGLGSPCGNRTHVNRLRTGRSTIELMDHFESAYHTVCRSAFPPATSDSVRSYRRVP